MKKRILIPFMAFMLLLSACTQKETTPPENASTDAVTISLEEARQIALAQIPGATDQDIQEIETDYEDGKLQYEGKLYYEQTTYEFEIDGYTGAVLKWEVESYK
ncbi:MAG: PepSY domain-containing protein [Lachnospiraceae bacterium]|nr:PepSY domain-containing protein [Lachnospiraceae bacterium]